MPHLHKTIHELTPFALDASLAADDNNEMHCEIIMEIMTTLWKVFPRLQQGREQLVSAQLFEDLQLLLGVSSQHGVLLRCVLESLFVFLQR